MAFIFYAYDFVLLAIVLTAIAMMALGGTSDAHLFGGIVFAIPLAIMLIMMMAGNRHRRRFAFSLTPKAVEIDAPKASDGINWTALLGGKGGVPVIVPRAAIREVMVRNSIAGRWSHNMTVAGLGPSGMTYVGVGAGGAAAAIGMATLENVGAGLRRFFYAISVGPRLARAYFVTIRVGKAEYVVGGGLDHQGASDLANDVLQTLNTLPMEHAA